MTRFALLLVCLATIAGCSDNFEPATSSPSHAPHSYAGVLSTSQGAGGTMTVVTEDAEAMPALMASGDYVQQASATIHVAGAGGDVEALGTLEFPSGPLTLGGGGYAFTGTRTSILHGTWTGPTGAGNFVAAEPQPGGDPPILYCGTFEGGDSGGIDLARFGNRVIGSFTGHLMAGEISGLVTGDIPIIGSFFDLHLSNGGTATSRTSATSLHGSWSANGMSGTWSASTAACQ